LADQGLISGTNFATGVLTARALDHDEFGTFSIIYGVLLFANILQSTLITQAHNVIGATLSGGHYRRYTSSTGLAQLLICSAEAALAAGLAAVAFARGWPAAPMLLALVPAIVFWQLQEFSRRVLYTEGRYAAAFWNDAVSYGGQAAVLALLFAGKQLRGTRFDGAVALYALAGTSAVAALLGLWQLRHTLAGSIDWHAWRENWHFGKWLAGGELMGWCSSLQMQLWWAAWLLGTWASADLRAAQILFGPTRVISFFLATVLPIRFARALHQGGVTTLHAKLRQTYVGLIPVVGTYCVLLAAFPKPLLHLVYGGQYSATDAARVLSLYSISAFLSYMQMVIAAALTASRQTRYIFAGSVWGCCVALVMSPTCIRMFGALGAIVSMMVTTLVVTTLFVHAYRSYVRAAAGAGFEVSFRAAGSTTPAAAATPAGSGVGEEPA
jgi:O-antigen/teichoic acid export membrane protein